MTKFTLSAIIMLLSLVPIGVDAQNATAKYMHISDPSFLRDGDEIIIVSKDNGVAMSRYQNTKKDYVLPCLIRLSKEDELELAACETDSMAVFKVKKITGGWRLKDSRCGWLSAGTKASYSLMFQERETEKTNEIDIKFSDEGNARISFVKFKNGGYLDYKPDSERFARYVKNDGYGKVQIYRRLVNAVVVESLTFGESGGNTDITSYYQDAYVHNVTIDRTFRADGGCYTLCLPFGLTESDIRTAFPGMQFKQLQDVEEVDDENVVYHFLSVKSTVAGEPYLVQFLNGVTKDVVKPVVKNKFILAAKPATLTGKLSSGNFLFVGTYDPVLLPADGHYRFVGADGKQLVTPNAEGNFKGLRAYFFMPSLYDNCKYDSNGKPRSVRISTDRGKSSSK